MKITSLLVSNNVNFDNDAKKITIDGVFDSIRASKFPAQHPQLTASVVTNGEEGTHDYKIYILKNGKEISSIKQEVLTGKRHFYIGRFYDTIFPEPGLYTLKAIVDQEELSIDFDLVLSK